MYTGIYWSEVEALFFFGVDIPKLFWHSGFLFLLQGVVVGTWDGCFCERSCFQEGGEEDEDEDEEEGWD